MMRGVVAFVVMLAALVVALPARAAPSLRTMIQPDTIEVGDSATLTLLVVPGDQVTAAQLPAVPSGLSVTGQGISPSFQITVSNGQMNQVVSARATFRIQGIREGTYTVGPPSVVSGGARLTGERQTLRVVPKGSIPRKQFDPFDPFGLLGGGNPFQMDQPPALDFEPSYPIDPKLNLDRPRDPGTFLHATVDKTQAVVGEQITLSVYVYADVTQADPDLSDPHEVGTSDFLRHSLLKNEANIERSGYARVGGRTYAVALLRKYALFPLRAGELEITPMRLRVGRGGERSSETLKVRVTEPPVEHRPAGYTIGDVGRFTVTADVAPREVERGAAISVNVEVSGVGNVPSALTVPARPGVTWLEPEVKDDMKVLEGEQWGGTRRFSYVVEPKKEGDIDLGEIAVSFYDPRAKSYDVARAALGVVHVKPGAAQATPDEAKVLANMPPLRKEMGATKTAENHLDDSNVFWGLLAMPTLLFGAAVGTRRAARRLKERAAERKTSPGAELKQRLRALQAAVDGDDGRAIDGASIRVLEAGATAHAGVNVRGVGGEAIVSVLTRAGVASDTAAELRDLLDACAAARFSPDGVDVEEARKRAARARAVVEKLEHGGGPTSG